VDGSVDVITTRSVIAYVKAQGKSKMNALARCMGMALAMWASGAAAVSSMRQPPALTA
jgi:hypothetical protein